MLTWQVVVISVAATIPISLLIKYLYSLIMTLIYNRYNEKFIDEVVDKFGPQIAKDVAQIIASRIVLIPASKEGVYRGDKGTKILKAAGGEDNKDSQTAG